ncbi:MAG: AbrB/MazE/SpoVT family DNA-binding domain-containing protein [Thaumarchaeota archaeon]|nr:AbrB/MazE/SpoVT family DNA-binding domain-containing protein [Nitrososphaerota archaeon]
MKVYQITKKFQVTIPKRLAEKAGIKPGDAVVFEETDGGIALKKVRAAKEKSGELRLVIEEFAKDVAEIKPHIKKAESALIENLSRHVSA